jgi:hypothetical protein
MVDQASRQAGYELRDISVRAVTWCAVGLIVAAIMVYVALAGLYKMFEDQNPSADAPSRIAFNAQMIAPKPRLQVEPTKELDQYLASENQKLNSYGWVDKRAGVVRIPISRAMDLVAQRGLPTRGPGTQNASGITPVQMQEQKAASTKP